MSLITGFWDTLPQLVQSGGSTLLTLMALMTVLLFIVCIKFMPAGTAVWARTGILVLLIGGVYAFGWLVVRSSEKGAGASELPKPALAPPTPKPVNAPAAPVNRPTKAKIHRAPVDIERITADFDSGSDGKDGDTKLWLELSSPVGVVASLNEKGKNKEDGAFPKNTVTTRDMSLLAQHLTPGDIDGLNLKISIEPSGIPGHDTWILDKLTLTFHLSGGGSITKTIPAFTLRNRDHQLFVLGKYKGVETRPAVASAGEAGSRY